jgi:hypothetical protein
MAHDPIIRHRKTKVLVAALVVGILVSALVAMGLVYMSGLHLNS